jgi:hypothetical protein
MAGNRSIATITFHKNATTPADGLTYMISADGNALNIDFVGTGAFTAIIEGKIVNESDFDPIMVVNLSTLDLTTTPNTFHTYQLNTTAWSYVRCRLTSVTGEVSVFAKLVG